MSSGIMSKSYQRKKAATSLLQCWYVLEEKLQDVESGEQKVLEELLSSFVSEENREKLNFYLARKQLLTRIRCIKDELSEELGYENSPTEGEQNTSLEE